jgi:polar amino acid transport system substrate-binding protein
VLVGMHRTVIIGAALAAALGFARHGAARELQQVLNTGTLRVGVTLYAPWATRMSNGDIVGFEVDVAKQLAADMGVRAEILPYDVERLIPALEAGEIDVIAAGLAITPERALHVNFSQPYAESGIALATNSERTASVTRLGDLDSDRYTVAAVEGSVAIDLKARVLPKAKVRLFPDVISASNALVAGEVDAYLEDEPVPTFLALEHPTKIDLPLDRPLLASRAAFAVIKGDPDFVTFLNAWINSRDADTWLPTTTNYWFKSLGWRTKLDDGAHR